MELIVKIGADQQGLQDTITRLKDQFRTMNTSAPAAWSPHFSGMNQYGNIMRSASAQGGFASSLSGIPIIGELSSKFTGLLGPLGLATAAFSGVAVAARSAINQFNEAYALSRQSRITGASSGMLDSVSLAAKIAGIDEASAFTSINKLNQQVGAANSGGKEAKQLFDDLGINPSGMSVDDLLIAIKGKFSGINDPAKRANLSKGLFGRGRFEMSELLANLDTGSTGLESADIETIAVVKKQAKSWWERQKDMVRDNFREVIALGLKSVGLGKGARSGDFTERSGAEFVEAVAPELGETFAERRARFNKWAAGATKTKSAKSQDEKPFSFQADSLAQAGLFAGSSLLFNPNMTIQQEQLNALQAIRANTERIGEGTFS